MKKIQYLYLIALILLFSCGKPVIKKMEYDYSKMDKITKSAHKKVEKFLTTCYKENYPVDIPAVTKIDSVRVFAERKHLDIYLNKFFGYIPYREENTELVYNFMKKKLGRKFRKYSQTIYAYKIPIELLIPNFYRSDTADYDFSRMPQKDIRLEPVVRNISKSFQPTYGLNNRNIALWHSHGWYYEQKLERWEWQRARLFQTVEDVGPIKYTLPYLVPMLENAGANVFLPRERDIQTNEVIVDNDSSLFLSDYFETSTDLRYQFKTASGSGFAIGEPPYSEGENPFRQGTFRIIQSDDTTSAQISWIPEIPESGEYYVSISYASVKESISDARYTVFHSGGKTEFLVNQQIGGGTWIYLGKFIFNAGKNPNPGKVVLTNQSASAGKIVTADAVRFGGGLGNVERNGAVSNRPRFVEAARYYLQYAGMPDTLVYHLNENNDYKDDYQSRGEWVNYLKGNPFGPNKNRKTKGLGIPVDLSLAFHTDAGITEHDTTIGTLLIYSTDGADSSKLFPDGMSRLANRDFADILQTQLVEDIKTKYDPVWNRRGMWDSDYSEAFRPNVPATLLELLSHQNFLDVKFFQDPRFRFDVSRAIYKAILKFLATQFQYEYIVQPLPVSHFQATFCSEKAVKLCWRPISDPLEPTAIPDNYIVYTRIEDQNFDNGVLADQTQMVIPNLSPNIIYSFKVTAVNSGGESFPSEVLSVCWNDQNPETVLIINGFDRICAPAVIETDKFAGFADFLDPGVPDKYEIGYTGRQYDFNPNSKWLDDDAPGFGASFANDETKIIPGNNFDFTFVHGRSIRSAGYSFASVSDEAVIDSLVDIAKFKMVDLILGEEKETDWPKAVAPKQFKTFPFELQNQIQKFCKNGGSLFVSGAYLGSDLFENRDKNDPDVRFARNTLKYFWRTNHASTTGDVFAVDASFTEICPDFKFVTDYHPTIYAAEAPDAIEPAHPKAKTILRYAENNMSAAVAFQGVYNVVAFGFPFETILNQENRDKVMQAVLMFFKK